MPDLKNPKLIWLKGFLFLILGLFASILIVVQVPRWEIVALLLIAIWAFCRCYYFVFYVIEHYVDETYHFAGLTSFVQYMFRKRNDVPQ